MSTTNGEFDSDSVDDILDAMLAEAKEMFGGDLNDTEVSVIRSFYVPIAQRLSEAQADIGLVLSSVQIDRATGKALDLLTALIGVGRRAANRSTGSVIFSRGNAATTDYVIPRGTIVQTDSNFDAIRFETTETDVLVAGETSVEVPVRATVGGVEGNVGSNALVVMPKPPSGIEQATNPVETTGGTDRETDDELRERAKDELADGAKATAAALVAGAKGLDGVTSVNIFINDTNDDNTGTGGLPGHSFELVIEGGDPSDIAQFIVETKAAGDTSYAGAFGTPESSTGELINGQEFAVDFSRPVSVPVYIDADIQVTDEFEGGTAVMDSIVQYVGGMLSSGNTVGGDLGVGDELLIGEIKYAIRSIRGVYDIVDLKVDISNPPAGTSNISIEQYETLVTNATDSSISITSTEI